MNGTCIKQDFWILAKDSTKPTPISTQDGIYNADCCFVLPALAESIITDSEFKNDKHSVIWFFGELYTTAPTMTLEKWNGNTWSTIATLNNDNFGNRYAFGFFKNKFEEKAIGYKIDWHTVLVNENGGEGDYRVKIVATPSIGDVFTDYSFEFCLREYTNSRADRTTYFTWYRNGQYGDAFIDEKLLDFGSINWFNGIRLPNSIFGFPTHTAEREAVKYQSGKLVWTKDELKEELNFTAQLYPEFLHRFIRTNILQADDIFVTDYNSQNPTPQVNRAVRPVGEYAPKWQRGATFASVELKFEPAIQNMAHKRE